MLYTIDRMCFDDMGVRSTEVSKPKRQLTVLWTIPRDCRKSQNYLRGPVYHCSCDVLADVDVDVDVVVVLPHS